MKKLIAVILFFSIGCVSKRPGNEVLPQAKEYFPNMKGCFLLYNLKTETYEKVINQENCKEQLVACSTFKVPLAVMAFDAGLLKDENVVFKWDFVKRDREVLNRDHNAKTWMADSVVWFSQDLTKKMGEKKLKKYLADFYYGNQDITGGLTDAWLVAPDKDPSLKISAYQQVDFMQKLWTDKLPAKKRAMQLARDITYLETSADGAKLNGKTGSNFYTGSPQMRLGWFISHVQKGESEYIVVTNFRDIKPGTGASYGGMKAKEITKLILNDLGLW